MLNKMLRYFIWDCRGFSQGEDFGGGCGLNTSLWFNKKINANKYK